MISNFINWCGDNYWWFVLVNFILEFGLPLLLGLLDKLSKGDILNFYGQLPGCIVALAFFQCFLGPVLYIFVAVGLIIMIFNYLSDLIKKLIKNGRE